MGCPPGGLDLAGCTCAGGDAPRPCYTGAPDKAGKGACVMGSQSCDQDQTGEVGTWKWGTCLGSGQPSPDVCGDNVDNDCNGVVDDGCQCMDGAMQSCVVAGEQGMQTCIMGQWGPCATGGCQGAMAGQPCNMVGTSLAVDPNSCNCPSAGTLVTSIYCDDTMVWQCFPADDCSPPACASCLQTHCSQYMTSPNPGCQTNLTTAVKWLEACGPDRNAWFVSLDNACQAGEVSQLNQCKFQYCIMNGTCSFY